MIINASSRTDIPNYYSEWLVNRLKEGFVYARNPYYPKKILKYQINKEVVDCFVFCTKNPKPMIDKLGYFKDYPLIFFVTITPYQKDIEQNVPPVNEVIVSFKELSKQLGKANVIWRYDPILITEEYSVEYHINHFEQMAKCLFPYTERCVISFVEIYEKLHKNFPELKPVTTFDKHRLLLAMSKIAKKYNIKIQTCADSSNYQEYNISCDGCLSIELLEKVLKRKIKKMGLNLQRENCRCLQSRDIGEYNSCPNGCKYCYANKDDLLVKNNYLMHDASSALLIGHVEEDDIIIDAKQESILEDFEQLSLL